MGRLENATIRLKKLNSEQCMKREFAKKKSYFNSWSSQILCVVGPHSRKWGRQEREKVNCYRHMIVWYFLLKSIFKNVFGSGYWTQGFVLVKHMFYHWAVPLAPRYTVYTITYTWCIQFNTFWQMYTLVNTFSIMI